MRMSRLGFAVIAAASVGLLAGCNPPPKDEAPKAPAGATGEAPKPAAGEKLKIAFVTNCVADFWTIAEAGTKKAAGELPNVEVTFKMPANGTPEEQKVIVDGLIADGAKAIAISPKDPANQTAYLNEVAGKALLLTQDSDAPESKRTVYIGTDNIAAGRQAGEMVKEALPNGGKIALFIGTTDQANAKDRIQGVKDALAGTKIEIVDTRTDNFDQAKAKTNASEVLTANPEIVGMVGLFAYNTPAILEALKGSGKLDKIKVVAFDEQDGTLQGIKDGHVIGTVVQQPYEFGYQSVKMMADLLGGGKPKIPENKKIIVETKVIKKAEVDAFWANLKKLTGK